MKLLISGYGGKGKPSIALYKFNDDLTQKELLWTSDISASSYLAYDGDMLFGISEKFPGNEVFLFKAKEDGYEMLDSKVLKGDGLCHVTYLKDNKALVGSCYGDGDIFSVAVEDKNFGDELSRIRQGGEEAKVTRAHSAITNADETKVYSANIALDRIYFYDVDEGKLIESGYYQLDEGEGPRHLALYEELGLLYIITEYSNKIIVLKDLDGKFEEFQVISTLPDDFEGESFCSTLCFTQDKKYLYGANRGSNTIAVYEVDEDGSLKKTADSSCQGDWPRDMSLIANDGFMAVTNERSGQIAIIKRDEETGALGELVNTIDFERPSFVIERL